jgi:hypothetical protein
MYSQKLFNQNHPEWHLIFLDVFECKRDPARHFSKSGLFIGINLRKIPQGRARKQLQGYVKL